MAYIPPSPPTPGEVGNGQLLIDPQNRTIWIGVDDVVDSNRSLLMSDIQGMLQSDADTLVAAQDYADALAVLKADVHHTHPVSDITGFNDAARAAVGPIAFMRGMVILWHGNVGNVGNDWSPTGAGLGGLDMKHWAVCNGDNAVDSYPTPNMTGKIPVGTPSAPSGAPGGWTEVNTKIEVDSQEVPAHSHGGSVGAWALTVEQMPQHRHGHNKGSETGFNAGDVFLGISSGGALPPNVYDLTGGTNFTTVTVDYVGGNQTHTHTITADPAHKHKINVTIDNVPWIKVVYIVRTI